MLRAISLAVLIGLPFLPTRSEAQTRWALTLERGWTTYSAAAEDSSADPALLRPYRPAIYTLRLAYDRARFGYALAIGGAFGEWSVNFGDFYVLPDESIHMVEIAPEVRYRLGTNTGGTTARLHAGPSLAIWTPAGDDTRSRLGAQGGASVSIPFAARWELDLRADVAVSKSLMNQDEKTVELHRTSTMRRGRLALGITRIL